MMYILLKSVVPALEQFFFEGMLRGHVKPKQTRDPKSSKSSSKSEACQAWFEANVN